MMTVIYAFAPLTTFVDAGPRFEQNLPYTNVGIRAPINKTRRLHNVPLKITGGIQARFTRRPSYAFGLLDSVAGAEVNVPIVEGKSSAVVDTTNLRNASALLRGNSKKPSLGIYV